MTKRELIEAVSNARPHLSRRDVETLVNAIFRTMSEALTRGERIEIRGFGSFIVKRRSAREGLNPKTGETVSVAAKRVPFFKAGKELKVRVDRKPAAAPSDERPSRSGLDAPTFGESPAAAVASREDA
jgi:integration host factor subunit beta